MRKSNQQQSTPKLDIRIYEVHAPKTHNDLLNEVASYHYFSTWFCISKVNKYE